MKKKNNRRIIILMGVIIGVLIVLCVLFATNKITFNSKVDENSTQNTSEKDNTDQKENENKKEDNTTEEKEVLFLYTSGDDNSVKGNPETLKIYSMDDAKIDFQYHAVWNEKDISGVAQKTGTNKYVYETNNYKIELNFNENSVAVKEYTNEQLISTVNLFK